MTDEKEDIEMCPKENSQTGTCPPKEGPISHQNGAAFSVPERSELVEVKPDLKVEKKIEEMCSEQEDEEKEKCDKDFSIKQEINKVDESDSDQSFTEDENLKEEIDSENDEILYKSISSKNYTTYTIKEEPIEDLKSIFEQPTLEFEKQKYHQKIFEDIISNSNKISIKDLQEQYMSNLREAANIEIYVCALCQYQTMKITNLQCHLLAVHNGKLEKKSFRCNKCDYESNFKSYMSRHFIIHKEKVRKKPKSKQKYYANHDYDDYEETSSLSGSSTKKKSRKEKYPCPECNYRGRTEDGLMRHMSTHKDRTKCDLCSYECRDKNEMKKHKETHLNKKYYQCYKCSYKNGNKTTLGRHLFNEHKISNEASKRSKICEICSFACSNVNALKIHYTSHKTVKDLKEEEIFKCPEPGCNHQTKLKNHLKIHMKVHEPPKFVCETCGLASRRKQTYEDHISTHKKASEIQWLQCPTCPYKARIKAHLRAHIRKGVHGEPMKRHIRLKYREGDQPVKKTPVKREKGVSSVDGGDKLKKLKRKRKPKSKNNVDEAIVNFGELASAFFKNDMCIM